MSFALPVFRSSFSLLYGTATPEAIIRAASEMDYETAVLMDKNNLYACYDFYYAAGEKGIKPIVGAEVTTAVGDVFFVCKNHDGFKNLSKLITHYQLNGKPSMEVIEDCSRDLICILQNDIVSTDFKDIFNTDTCIGLDYNQPSRAYRLARQNDIEPVALSPVSFLSRQDYSVHRLLRAIDGGHLLSNLPETEGAHVEEYLKRAEFYDNYFAPFPDAVANTRQLAEKCQLIFPQKKNILPDIKIEGDHYEKLKDGALKGLRKNLGKIPGRYQSRLEYELSVIDRTGFVDYFLIVGEIVEFCRREHITCVGRGSAAGSLVAYSLGFTQVDPIRENLYFERFLNEARSDCPDVDLDIDWRRRDDVLDFVYGHYGHGHVAMMATYVRFQPRLAVRETAKAMGIAPNEINQFAREISNHPLERNTFPKDIPARLKIDRDKFAAVLKMARSIYGLPRHLGIHAGGIVITPEPITDYVPLEYATKGIVVTQCDMYQAEKIGLVKIDILGQRGLAVIADCHEIMRQNNGNFKIPDNDAKTRETLQKGKTIGVFQIESPGMRALLKDLKPKELNDITLALALIRPGASESGMKKVFLDRFHGLQKTAYPHNNLESVLKETHGVFIYQEQVILAAQKIAGFNLPASDLLRRAITKARKKSDREKLGKRFMAGAEQNGIDDETARNIYNQLRQFASFGFCKAHAATYGYLAYQSAYFKTHYPDVFMTAVLQNGGGYYPAAVYVAEARRLGIKVMPPDVNISETDDSLQAGRIYIGISRVREISQRTLAQIEQGRPFHSFEDFYSRVDLSERETENLIKVGFFDSIETSRPKLLWEYRLQGKKHQKQKGDLFGGKIPAGQIKNMPDLVPFSRYEVFKAEREILELPASFHPLSLFDSYSPVDIDRFFGSGNGKPAVISGWLADRKRIKTRDGQQMVFLTFDSPDDTFEVVLFPDLYLKYRDTIRNYRYLTVEGQINREGGNVAIIAERLYPCPTGLKESKFI